MRTSTRGSDAYTVNTIADKNVLVAEGAKNLGGLISRDLATQGAHAVTVHYNSETTCTAAEKTGEAIRAAGAQAHLVQAELTGAAAVTSLVQDADRAMGSIDIAINTTGMVIKKPLPQITEEDFDKIFAINAKTALFFIQPAGSTSPSAETRHLGHLTAIGLHRPIFELRRAKGAR